MQNELAVSQELDHYRHIAQEILILAKKAGADAAEVSLSKSTGFSATARLGEVDTIEHCRDKSLEITVYVNQATGTASTTDVSYEALEEAVQAAYRIATATEPDPAAGLADPDKFAYDYPELDLYYPWDINVEHAVDLAKQYEQAGMGIAKEITNSEGVTINTHQGVNVYANTHGFVGGYPTSSHSITCGLVASDGTDMQREHEYTVARDPALLMSGEEVVRRTAEKVLKRMHAQRLSTRKAPVIFAAEVARSLLRTFINAISGGQLYRDATFLRDALGKQIFPSFLSIQEQPHLLKALGSAPFDHEGVATQDRLIVKDGILQGYVLSSYSARKLGLSTTGNAGGVHNVSLNTQVDSLQPLLKQMDTGLLVTELMGQGVNLVTGDYSRGAAGFWVEQGQIQYPVHEITIAGNLQDMFQHIVAVAHDIDYRSSIRSGSILLEEMVIAGSA